MSLDVIAEKTLNIHLYYSLQLSDVIQYLKSQLKEPSRELLVVVPDAMQSIYRGGTVD